VESRWISRISGARTSSNVSSIVLFAEEREALAAVRYSTYGESGTEVPLLFDGGMWSHRVIEEKIDGSPCPFLTQIRTDEAAPNNNAGQDGPVHPYDSTSRSAAAVLVMDNLSVAIVPAIAPAPYYGLQNYNLGTFLEWNATTKPLAQSNVTAMHGNYPVERANALYRLDNLRVVTGGFVEPAAAVGFVGRA
jgi:hypothetical protein